MRFSGINYSLLVGSLFLVVQEYTQAQTLQAVAVEWGEYIPAPRFGYYARVVNEHELPDCQIEPAAENLRDWRSSLFRSQIASLNPQILRFPAGTAANFWYWENENKTVVGNNGVPRVLEICEGSLLDIPESKDIGCPGPLLDFTADRFEDIVRKTSTTLESYRDAMNIFRDVNGIDVNEMFVLGPIDPFYYVGSPQLDFETPGFTPAQKRLRIGQKGYERMIRQLNKILKVYCGDCTSYDGNFDFEIGNEVFLSKYGRFFPFEACFAMSPQEVCDVCRTDITFYADLCEAIIPVIRAKFPNARIGVVGSKITVAGQPWTQTLIDRFGPSSNNPVEGVSVHFYALPFSMESLSQPLCEGNPLFYNTDQLLHYPFTVMEEFYESKACSVLEGSGLEVWATEFNSLDRSDDCIELYNSTFPVNEPLFYLDNWLHALNVIGQFNSMMAYSSTTPDPWLNASGGVPFSKLIMHSMYGNPHASAVMADGTLTGAGIASTLLLDLLDDATDLRRIIVAPSTNVSFDEDGAWFPNIPDGEILPYHYLVNETTETGTTQTPTFDVYGWIFRGPTSYKLMLVNLRNAEMNTGISSIPGFEGTVSGIGHHVPAGLLTEKVTDGLNSPFVLTNSVQSNNGKVVLPPYSISILEGDLPPDCSTTPILASNACYCNPPLLNHSNFEATFGMWWPGGPGAVRVPTQPAYPAQLGTHMLRLKGNSATAFITAGPAAAQFATRMKIKFEYAGFGMNSQNDRLLLQVSTNGGGVFTTIREFTFGQDFLNGEPSIANVIYEGPFSQNFKVRIRSITNTGSKDFFLDNVKIYACNEAAPAGINPIIDSIEEASTEARIIELPKLEVYPNPFKDAVNVTIANNNDPGATYNLINAAGQTVQTGMLDQEHGTEAKSIYTSHLPNGLYTLLVYTGSNKLTKKILLQR